MDGGILSCANKIKSICLTLKALSNDGAFSAYRRKLFAELQRLSLSIGLEDRMDDYNESDHPRDEEGKFAKKGGGSEEKGVRKGKMKPETPVSYKNPGQITKSKGGRVITHFNHDEETMQIVKPVKLLDEYMDQYELQAGKIEHLTAFAGKGTESKLGVAESIARQFGGKPEDWKHVKGIGKVKGRDGVVEEADIHWFENENVGQAGWKIKQKRSEMGEGQIYWKEK